MIPVNGVSTDPQSDPGTTGEVMLDVEIAGALGGGSKVAVYFSTFDEKGLVDCLSAVIGDSTNDPAVVSISYGWDENQTFNNEGVIWSPAAIDHVNQSLLALAQRGVTVCVSTGNDGSEAQLNDGRAHVTSRPQVRTFLLSEGPRCTCSRAPRVLARSRKLSGMMAQAVGGTGGGVSDITPVPAWQQGIVPPSINPGSFTGRAIPDVAADADPATGYQVMTFGRPQVVGGTSASAPLWACLIKRINTLLGARAGNFNALLYSKFGPGQVLRDIVVGNNNLEGRLGGQYPAKPGWDACTGWGSPDGAKLLAALKGG